MFVICNFPIWVVIIQSCLRLLHTLEVTTYLLFSFSLGGFLILLLYLLISNMIYNSVVSHKKKFPLTSKIFKEKYLGCL